MKKEKFNVQGMTCSACAGHVEKAVKKTEGVSSVAVNLLQNSMQVEYDGSPATAVAIIDAVEKAGYSAAPTAAAQNPQVKKEAASFGSDETIGMKRRLVLSVCFLIPLLYVSMGHMMGLPLPSFLLGMENGVAYGMTQFLLTLVIMYLNRSYFQKGFKGLFHGAPSMDTLIALGASAAVVYGVYAIIRIGYGLGVGDMELAMYYHMDLYFESAGTILTLITVGKYLETRSKGKTGDAIGRLLDLAPKTAVKEADGVEKEIPLEQVAVDDILVVRSGSAVPVDGVVVEGYGAVDESAITGESLPVEKIQGSQITGGTVLNSGYLKMRAVRVGENTALSQIIRLVEEANAGKAPIAKLADRVSGVFVPIVIGIAILSTVVWLLSGATVSFALSIGIAVLVISCPCALGLATPVAIMVATGKGAEHGIMFKSAESLETAHHVNTVVLDKTGTVTMGTPSVVGVFSASEITEERLLSLAAATEYPSEHPLAKAIVSEAEKRQIEFSRPEKLTQFPGEGVETKVEGRRISAGNRRMMERLFMDLAPWRRTEDEAVQRGQTPLYFADDCGILGMIALADTVKPSAQDAIAALKKMHITPILLTGDRTLTAQVVAKEVGIDTVIGEVLPDEKEKTIRSLQMEGRKVAMVGDGINDAPALAAADVGIAIGAGTDIAIESADIVLMKSDLMDVAGALQLSAATIRNIKQNLFWAFFYNCIGIPLAAGVFYSLLQWKLNPMFASAAMSLSSLFVVTNALRLRFFRPRYKLTENVSVPAAPLSNSHTINSQIKESNKGGIIMKKKLTIEGMSCNHCVKAVTRALNAIDGVTAEVDLASKTAVCSLSKDVADDVLRQAVIDADFEVVSVEAI